MGVSGGPDSTALLILLMKLQKKLKLQLFAVHLNHGFSGPKALKQEMFCQNLANRLHIPFFSKAIQLRALAKENAKSLEEMGRNARYQFFCEVAKKVKAKKIATAHTLDDQAETILMRLVRGTGLRGLGGIPVLRQEKSCLVIRPLLNSSKKEILSFLKKIKQPYCLDPSNQKDFFTRNRIRNKLLPWMEKNLNPQVKQALLDAGQLCLESSCLLDHLAKKALKKAIKGQGPRQVTLRVRALQSLDPAVQSQTLLAAISLLSAHRQQLSFVHISSLRKLLQAKASSGAVAQLPYHLQACRQSDTLRIFDSSKE